MNEETTGSAIHVEVAYATIERQCVIPLKVTNGTTAYAAIRLSKIEQEFEEIDIDGSPIGIFGKSWTENPDRIPKSMSFKIMIVWRSIGH